MLDIIGIIIVVITTIIMDCCDNLVYRYVIGIRRGGRLESFTEVKSQWGLERLIEISRNRNKSKQVLKDAYNPFFVQG